jgi:hypothetical protein
MRDQNVPPQPRADDNQEHHSTPFPVFESSNPGLLDVSVEADNLKEGQCTRKPRPAGLEAIRHFTPS